MGAVLSLALKDLRLLLRDKVGFFFTFFFPLLMAVFFGSVFSGGGDGGGSAIPIVVVDEDRTEASAAYIGSLASGGAFTVTPLEGREAAQDLVRRGKQTAFVVVPAGFGEASERIFWGEPMRLVIGVDPSRKAEAGMIEGLLTARAFERMQEVFTDTDRSAELAREALDSVRSAEDLGPAQRLVLEPFLGSLETFLTDLPAAAAEDGGSDGPAAGFRPIAIETVSVAAADDDINAYAVSFPQGIVWGVMGCAAGFGISLVVERTRGTLTRLQMSPAGRWRILLGKALACFATTVTVAAVLLAVAWLFFGVTPRAPLMLVAAVVSVAIGFVGIMMLLSVCGKTEAAAGGIGWSVLLVMAMIGGGMIPLMAMPEWMANLSHFSPVKWAILAMEGAIWRGFTPAEMLLPCGIMLAIGVAGFAAGARVFDWAEA